MFTSQWINTLKGTSINSIILVPKPLAALRGPVDDTARWIFRGGLNRLVVILCASALTIPATAQSFTTIINVPPEPPPRSIGSDTQLNLYDGGLLFSVFDAGNPDGSSANVEVNINGGTVERGFSANFGSTVNINGGRLLPFFFANSGSTTNIKNGVLSGDFSANAGSVVNISGGDAGQFFTAMSDSIVNISGGIVGQNFNALANSEVNLFGLHFTLDGTDITGSLNLGESELIADRDLTLAGLLADGSAFSFDLNSVDIFGEDTFDPDAILTITLVPEPTTLGPLGIGALCALRRRRLS